MHNVQQANTFGPIAKENWLYLRWSALERSRLEMVSQFWDLSLILRHFEGTETVHWR